MLFLLLILLTEAQHAEIIQDELPGSKLELRLWDRARVDLMYGEYAYEIDWAPKWAEGIGQSLYYGIVTGKKPGLILLMKKGEGRFVYRAQTVCAKHGIKLIIRKVE